MRTATAATVLLAALLAASPALARQSLGIFSGWGAFRDDDKARCYALARPDRTAGRSPNRPFASIGFWPGRGVRGQFGARLSRARSTNSTITLTLGGRRFRLVGSGGDVWSADAAMDRSILAAIRQATAMSIESVGRDGRPIVDAYALAGAPSAIDAAALGCLRG